MVVKISFTEKDAAEGKELKDTILELLNKESLMLVEKHEGLQSENMPKIENLSEEENFLKLVIKYEDKSYEINILQTEPSVLRSGLCWMYGYGFIKYNYELPIFQGLEKNVIDRYQRFAVQIWERNIHRDWMQKDRGYTHHNGDHSKGPKFLYGVSSDDRDEKWAAIQEHRRITDAEEGGETPHHSIKTKEDLRVVLMNRGEDKELEDLLIEAIYDQATATTRTHYPDRKKYSFEERLTKNMNKGYYCDDFRWKPGKLKDARIAPEYEEKIWSFWLDAHETFKEYWTKKFGENEELWQAPEPKSKFSQNI